MLWKIVNTPHKLLGSVHVLPEKAALPSWVTESYQGIERFVFEADHRSPLIGEVGVDRTGAYLNWPGVVPVYQRAEALLASLGCNDPFDALRPWKAAFYVISRLLPRVGLSHDHGIDNRFRVMADSNGFNLDFLEPPTRAFDLIDSSCNQAKEAWPFLTTSSLMPFLALALRSCSASSALGLGAILPTSLPCLETGSHSSPSFSRPSIIQRNREWTSLLPGESSLIPFRLCLLSAHSTLSVLRASTSILLLTAFG